MRKRKNEKYLSAYLLEYFKKSSEKENMKAVKKFMEEKTNFSLRKNGGFTVLNIEKTKKYINDALQKNAVSFKKTTLPHCGIFFEEGDDLAISKLLSRCVDKIYLVGDLS